MKFIFLILMAVSVSITANAQKEKLMTLPNANDVARIEISKTSAIEWYKAKELLKLLPKFVASEGTYLTKQPFQYGTFVLKNGKKIKWLAGGKDSILLYESSREDLFRVSKKGK